MLFVEANIPAAIFGVWENMLLLEANLPVAIFGGWEVYVSLSKLGGQRFIKKFANNPAAIFGVWENMLLLEANRPVAIFGDWEVYVSRAKLGGQRFLKKFGIIGGFSGSIQDAGSQGPPPSAPNAPQKTPRLSKFWNPKPPGFGRNGDFFGGNANLEKITFFFSIFYWKIPLHFLG